MPATLHAQCDASVSHGSWSIHPHPDSIYVNFYPDVTSNAPQNPRLYDFSIMIRFNAAPIDQHPLQLRWSHGIGCPVGCPSVICAEKEWSYKGVVFRDNSKCTLNPMGVCGCPPLGDPVPHQKSVRKPAGPGTIEIEIIPLNLQGCTPVNPANDKVQFFFDGPGPLVPAVPPGAVVILIVGLSLVGLLRMRLRPVA